jgi:hypothetical protein
MATAAMVFASTYLSEVFRRLQVVARPQRHDAWLDIEPVKNFPHDQHIPANDRIRLACGFGATIASPARALRGLLDRLKPQNGACGFAFSASLQIFDEQFSKYGKFLVAVEFPNLT